MSKLNVLNAPETILLVDDHYLAASRNVQRTFHAPEKRPENPILCTGQVDWEIVPLIFGSVLYDPNVKKYRMWYASYGPSVADEDIHYWAKLRTADSDDGLHWQRRKRIVFESTPEDRYIEIGAVLIERDRYVLVATMIERTEQKRRVYRLAYSNDGLRWNRGGEIPYQKPGHVDRHCLLKDPATGEYLFYFRGIELVPKKYPTVDFCIRTVCFQSSRDLEHWSDTKLVMAADKSDPPYTNIYSLMPFFRGQTLMGVYQLHYQHRHEEVVTTHLAWSHDRTTWHRRHEEFIPLGAPGQWDRFNNAVASGPLIIGDTMYFYYSGRLYRHGGYEPKSKPDTGQYWSGIGVATMKLDRFASLAASFDAGTFTTKPMLWPKGKDLRLNADCRWGSIEIEMHTPGRKKPIKQTRVEGVEGVRLATGLKFPATETPVRLTFKLTNARIYALSNQ